MDLKQKTGLILIVVSGVLLGCLSGQTVADEPVRIMPLGDSITRGFCSTNLNGYRKPLYNKLVSSGYSVDFVGSQTDGDFEDHNHEGHGGWHASGGPYGGLLPYVYGWLVNTPANIILLHIGTNDITGGGEDANEVSDILDEIDRYEIAYSENITVILALIINRKNYSEATTQFNNNLNVMALNRIANGDDIIIVDMESVLDYSTDMYDNLHPNDDGYAKMANVWHDALDSLLLVSPIFTSTSSYSSVSDSATLSWSHTIGSSGNRILVVSIASEDDDPCDLVISSVTYNDLDMNTVEGSGKTVGTDDRVKTELYYLLDGNLPSSGSYIVEVSYAGNVRNKCGGAISLANVEQRSAEAVATNSNEDANAISTDITIQTPGSWVIDVVGGGDSGTFTAAVHDMQKWFEERTDSASAAGSTKPVESAEETTMAWNFDSGSTAITHSVAAFAPARRTVSGHILEPNAIPIDDVFVSAGASSGSDMTDPNGYYEVLVSYGWSGTVTPTKAEYIFGPVERTYNNVIVNQSGQDYQDISIYDLDWSGFISWGDVDVICENWLGPGPEGDVNNNGIVDFLDFAELALVW